MRISNSSTTQKSHYKTPPSITLRDLQNPIHSRTCASSEQNSFCDQASPFVKGRGWGGNVNMNFEEALCAQERRYPQGQRLQFNTLKNVFTLRDLLIPIRSRTCAYRASSTRHVLGPSTYVGRTLLGCQRIPCVPLQS